jgi:hypothetical protein
VATATALSVNNIPPVEQTNVALANVAGTATAVAQPGAAFSANLAAISAAQAAATAGAIGQPNAANATAVAAAQVAATAVALLPTQPPPTSALGAINQTATAIAGAFLTATAEAGGQGGGAVVEASPAPPTQEVVGTPGFVTAVPTQAELPDTGLFDEIAAGGTDGIGLLAAAVVGLVGVIVISRVLRARSRRDDDGSPDA